MSQTAQAQPAPPVNIRGVVTALTDTSISVTEENGLKRDMRLSPDWSVQVMHPIAVSSIPPGRFVGAIEHPQPDGVGRAVEVHMFLPGVRMGEGHMPWDKPAGAMITHGDIGPVTSTPEGETFELTWPGGKRKIFAPKGTPAVFINNETRDRIKVGVGVFILGWPQPDGSMRVDAVATGPDGKAPPL